MIPLMLGLGAWRVTRLLVEDTILDRPRAAIVEWAFKHHRTGILDFVDCPHCVSIWIAAITVGIAARTISVPNPLLVFGAVAGGCSLIADYRPNHA